MGLFSKSEPEVLQSPIFDMVDEEPLISMDARGANLFVYDKFVVIDRTKGGLFNLGNRTYKIIPIKNIMAIQVKSTGATTGFIEFATPGHEYTGQKGFDRVNDENTVNFASELAVAKAAEVVRYLLPKII
jgi:hypothetical protein